MKHRLLRWISFSLLALVALVLAVGTILESVKGAEYAQSLIYHSPFFIALWGGLVAFSLLYIFKQKNHKKPLTLLIHLALVFILIGALTTFLTGEKGTIHLRKGETITTYTNEENQTLKLPFSIRLNNFSVKYYPATRTPQDFVSSLIFKSKDGEFEEYSLSMNKIIDYQSYRFFQSAYDEDGKGTIISLSYDPYGQPITYFAYGFMLFSFLLFFFGRQSEFYRLIRSPLLKSAFILTFFLGNPIQSFAENKDKPEVLPKEVAEQFCDLYILYNGRVCPLQTFAKDFTIKLYGKGNYKHYSVEQVFTGWLFYYSDWAKEPMIKVGSKATQNLLGIEGTYTSFFSFFDKHRRYKLASSIAKIYQGVAVSDKKGIEQTDEKYNIIAMLRMGKLVKLFPYKNQDGQIEWYAPNSRLDKGVAEDKALFINKSVGYLLDLAKTKDYEQFTAFCKKVKRYQELEVGREHLPSDSRFEAEKWYNKLDYTKLLFKVSLLIGLLAFFYMIYCLVQSRKPKKYLIYLLNIALIWLFIYLSVFIGLRAYISGHFPTSNGYETMQFLAWTSLLAGFCLQFKFRLFLPSAFLLSGLTLLVASLGQSTPKITSLMPVLASPLLSIHVATIMVSYLLFAFIMFNGLAGLILYGLSGNYLRQVKQLQVISQILLYPAVFLLTIGIFIGAVWANVSWGRYWGWDPKEVWALITMLIYAFPLHSLSLKRFQSPLFFHLFMVFAFLSVLFTYFGVNYLLGGLHSYANS